MIWPARNSLWAGQLFSPLFQGHAPSRQQADGANIGQARCRSVAHHDSDYYRARAIEQRGRAHDAEREDVAAIHRDLAQKYEGLADQHDSLSEQFDALTAEASRLISKQVG